MKSSVLVLVFMSIVGGCWADWPQYLGPDRNAVTTGVKLARSWPEGGPEKLWSLPVGDGHGGASVHGDEVFILDRIVDESDILRCIDFATGKEKWRYTYAAPGRHPHPGSRGVPTVDAEYVWTVGSFGHMYCFSRKTRAPVWSMNILEKFEAEDPRWGVSQSPLIYRDMVIVAPQGKKGGVVAIDKKTGDVRWASRPLKGIGSYVSPTMVTIGGVDQIIGISAGDRKDKSLKCEVASFRAADGKLLWSFDGFDTYVNIAPPAVIGDGRLFFTNGSNGNQWLPISVMIKVERKGDEFNVEEIFKTHEAAGKMHTPVVRDGYIYFNGIRKPQGMRCMSLDGKVMWGGGPEFQLGAFIMADGLIINQSGTTGDIYLIEPGPDGYKELGNAELFTDLQGEPWAPLALSDGKLLVRDGAQLVCVNLE